MIGEVTARRGLTAGISLVILLFSLLTGCLTQNSYFIVGSVEDRRVLGRLFKELEEEKNASRFTLIKEISDLLFRNGFRERQILFLTEYVEKNPNDPYNSFYLALVAEAYEEINAIPFAIHYYERILKNHPDILVQGSSVHFLCLKALLKHVTNEEYRIGYYKELISRFGDYIDKGAYHYYLAKTYEDLGLWDLSIQAYKRFLSYPETRIPGHPDNYNEIEEKVAFYDSKKSWTVPDLKVLVTEMQLALQTKNAAKLNQYKAKINFFSMYWGQKNFDQARLVYFNISSWLLNSKVVSSKELESDSNAREAFLKTWNWSYRVSTWYFYFRRVSFPADQDIDGRWEWAGIYFGEKG